MTKRFLSMILAILLMTAVLVPAALADNTGEGDYYVYTANGKTLNVRDYPGGEVIGHLKYGAKIHVDCFVDENWAMILYQYNKPGYGTGEYACYISRRFLTKTKPAAKPQKASPEVNAESMGDLNAEFRTAKRVEPYTAYIRPTRVSGWISMHWAPSVEAEIIATYKAHDAVTVIRETANWLQVEDPKTGNVGFIIKTLVEQ